MKAIFTQKANLDEPIFNPLTPKSNIDLGFYRKALDFAFSNNEVRNIAVSGAYGSGKSSIIASYEKKTKNDFLHISLAHFAQNDKKETESENDDESKKTKTSNISILEWKILNQLVHQIDTSKIPQTLLRVKKNTPTNELIRLSVMALVFISAFIHTLLLSTMEENFRIQYR